MDPRRPNTARRKKPQLWLAVGRIGETLDEIEAHQ
jgi:hypothetical protein